MAKRAKRLIRFKQLLGAGWGRYQRRRQRLLARSASQVRFALTREGAHLLFIVLFIFVGAVARDINLLILIATAMIGLLLLQWRICIGTISGLTATRRMLERTTEGSPIDCLITASNRKRWLGSWLIKFEDNIQQLAPKSNRQVGKGMAVLDELAPGGTGCATYRLTFNRRGSYQIGPCVLSTRFPLSLGRSWRTESLVQPVIVHPRLGHLLPAAKAFFHIDRVGQVNSSRHAGAHETEFFGLRPWATGDSRRWIHWRTTAKQGELTVKQFDRLQQQQACVLLDLHLSKNDRSADSLIACERAIAFVATLATRSAQIAGARIAVAIAAAEVVTLTNIQSPVLVRNLLDQLAVLRPSPQPQRAAAISGMSMALLSNPNLLVVSTRETQVEQLQVEMLKSISPSALKRIHIQWLDVRRGDLEPYFQWTPSEFTGSAVI